MKSNLIKAIIIDPIATVTDCAILNIVIPFYLHFPDIVSANVNTIQLQYPIIKVAISIKTKFSIYELI
jgi:hypothetical protein